MNTQQITVTIVSTLLSGLLAAIITICINKRSEKLRLKQNLVMDLFGYRYQMAGKPDPNDSDANSKGFIKALNCIPIVFHTDQTVLNAYDKFYDLVLSEKTPQNIEKADEALVVLMKALCKSAYIQCSGWNDSRFKRTLS